MTSRGTPMEFCKWAINQHLASEDYKTALTAQEYMKRKNPTIASYQKLLYKVSGEAVPDNYGANYKLYSSFFKRFITQETQFLLGNGVTFSNAETKDKFGTDFDTQIQKLGKNALVEKVAFGFWNFDHIEVFKMTQFVPIYDEETGGLAAGIRFWQLDQNKPLRATFYEMDGYTDFIWEKGNGRILNDKRKYILTVRVSEADGMEILDGENYPAFPIIPMWGNEEKQSELIGIREQIDAYDLIKSGFCNTVDEASMVYWTIQNGGGMDDIDLAKFLEHMKRLRAAVVEDDGASAESHMIEAPYQSREALLERLRSDLYDDFMALDTKNIANGAITATQIQAAYEPLNNKADEFEYCVRDFIDSLMKLTGIEDEVTFTRSMVVNKQEEIQNIINSSEYLSREYITGKILTIMGDSDQTETVLEQITTENDTMPIVEE